MPGRRGIERDMFLKYASFFKYFGLDENEVLNFAIKAPQNKIIQKNSRECHGELVK